MGAYRNISNELKTFFSNHNIFRVLLPLDSVFLFGSLGLMVINRFASIGSLLSALVYYCFLLGLLLTYANFHERNLFIGLFVYAGIYAFDVIKYGIFNTHRYIYFYGLVTCLVFAGLGYLVYKNSLNNRHRGM